MTLKPLLLKIKGLNSFKEEQVVDFSKLSDYGVFGIFGKTGSGKSTIIDAITYALFGKITRHSNQIREAINMDSDTLSVTFLFEMGDNLYEIVKSHKKGKKGELKNVMARFSQINDDNSTIICDKSSDIDKEIQSFLGLTYEDFSRCVILPQGKFSEFLLLQSVDRAKMLERLFNLSDYGQQLVDNIKNFFNENKNEIDKINLLIGEIGEINEEIIASKKESILSLSQSINETGAILSTLREQEKKIENNVKLIFEYEEAVKSSQDLKKKEDPINNKKDIITKHEKATIIKPIWDNFLSIELELKSVYESLSLTESRLKKYQSEENENKSLYKQLEAIQISKEIKEVKGEFDKLSSTLKSLIIDKNKCLDESKKLELEKNNFSEKLSVILSRKKEVYISPAKREIISCCQEYSEKFKQVNSKLKTLEDNFSKINSIYEEDKVKLEKNQESLEKLQKEIEGLGDGEPCPTCGAIRHPIVIKNKEKIQELLLVKASLSEKASSNKNQLDQISKDLENCKNEKEEIVSSLQGFKEQLNADNLNNYLKQAKSFDEELENIQKDEDKLRNYIDSLNLKTEEMNKSFQSFETQINKIEATNNEKQESINKCFSRLKNHVEIDEFSYFESIEKNIDEVYKKSLKAKENYDLAVSNITKEQNDLLSLNTKLKMLDEQFKKETNLLEAKKIELEISDLNLIKTYIITTSQKENLLNEISDFENSTMANRLTIARLDGLLTNIDKNFCIEENKRIKQALEEFSKALELKTKAIAVLELEIQKDELNFEKTKTLNKNRSEKLHEKALLEELIQLFKEKKFIKFLAKRHLEYVVLSANSRLQEMTKGRYSLVLQTSDFLIRDDFSGGALRSPKSLSGGEIFIVSLSLALALSSKIQLKSNYRLKFFFLDEGFGTLDSESLEEVMDALEKLASEDLTVGIISHVEELKFRIEKKINVIGPSRGSHGSIVKLI